MSTGSVAVYLYPDLLGLEAEVRCTASYTVTSRGRPAKTQGDPNDCYPEEAPEFEVDDTVALEFQGLRWSAHFSDLPPLAQQEIEDKIYADIDEGDPDDDREDF